MSPEEQVKAVKAALAEAGYPDGKVWWEPRGVRVDTFGSPLAPNDGALWRALVLVASAADPDADLPCWPCWREQPSGCTCDHDWRTEPWPPVPERVS